MQCSKCGKGCMIFEPPVFGSLPYFYCVICTFRLYTKSQEENYAEAVDKLIREILKK